jgi:hypothetical protein
MTTATEYPAAAEWPPVKTSLPDWARDGHEEGNGTLSTFLGLFSIGLGVWELLHPAKVGARTGVPYRGLIRAYGVREIATGVAILASRDPAPGLWARVAGDVLDLATLGASYAMVGEAGRRRACEAAAAVAAVTALDIVAASAHGCDSNGRRD